MQSKKHSLLEATANIASGAVIAFTITQTGSYLGFWVITTKGNFLLTTILTFVSLLRSYIWRRIFNKSTVSVRLSKADINKITEAKNCLEEVIIITSKEK